MFPHFLLLECLHEPSIDFVNSPGQLAFLLNLLLPEFLEGCLTVTGQFPERISPIRIQIEIMAGRFIDESKIAPKIRVDGMFHNETAMLFKKRADCGRKQINRATSDQAMNVKPPSLHRERNPQSK